MECLFSTNGTHFHGFDGKVGNCCPNPRIMVQKFLLLAIEISTFNCTYDIYLVTLVLTFLANHRNVLGLARRTKQYIKYLSTSQYSVFLIKPYLKGMDRYIGRSNGAYRSFIPISRAFLYSSMSFPRCYHRKGSPS